MLTELNDSESDVAPPVLNETFSLLLRLYNAQFFSYVADVPIAKGDMTT